MHENQLDVTVGLVREVVSDQFPQWTQHPVWRVHSVGTVNAIFRIGEKLTARFPLQPGDVDETRERLGREADAARELSEHTSLPAPEPVAIGEPGAGYPLPWSVQTWIPGHTAVEKDPSDSVTFAVDLADFITEIRAIDIRDRRFTGGGRGGDLRSHDAWMETCFERSDHLLDVPRLRLVWARMRELPRESADVMTHGDLTPGNVIVSDGRLAGILDTGGVGPADPALDLVCAWHMLDAGPRRVLRDRLGCDELEWERGRAWAFEQALGVVWYYASSNRPMSQMGKRTLDRILATEPTP